MAAHLIYLADTQKNFRFLIGNTQERFGRPQGWRRPCFQSCKVRRLTRNYTRNYIQTNSLVAARLGQRISATLEPEAVLPAIVETIADSLKSPYVAISLPQGDSFTIASATGLPTPAYFTWPLVYHRQVVGHLILGARGR